MIFKHIVKAIISRATRRAPDFIIGGHEHPYLLRWWLIPRNRFFNIYLHKFMRSDDDRAFHDHPWLWCSILLRGSYVEWSHPRVGDALLAHVERFNAGTIRIHRARYAHRLVVDQDASCWTLFITGPRTREWGFHCPNGWVPWFKFTNPDDPGAVGKGCAQ